jgi:hypothetical protein
MTQLFGQLQTRSWLLIVKIFVFVLISCGLLYGANNSVLVFAFFALLMVAVSVPTQLTHVESDTVKSAFTQSFDLLLNLGLAFCSNIEKFWKSFSNGTSLRLFFICRVLSQVLSSLYVFPPIVTKFTVTAPLSNRQ